jgi:hypothetical protein
MAFGPFGCRAFIARPNAAAFAAQMQRTHHASAENCANTTRKPGIFRRPGFQPAVANVINTKVLLSDESQASRLESCSGFRRPA